MKTFSFSSFYLPLGAAKNVAVPVRAMDGPPRQAAYANMGCLISGEMDEFISAITPRKTARMTVFRGYPL
jgi:hypothetical protein